MCSNYTCVVTNVLNVRVFALKSGVLNPSSLNRCQLGLGCMVFYRRHEPTDEHVTHSHVQQYRKTTNLHTRTTQHINHLLVLIARACGHRHRRRGRHAGSHFCRLCDLSISFPPEAALRSRCLELSKSHLCCALLVLQELCYVYLSGATTPTFWSNGFQYSLIELKNVF